MWRCHKRDLYDRNSPVHEAHVGIVQIEIADWEPLPEGKGLKTGFFLFEQAFAKDEKTSRYKPGGIS
jgi:hypothetical protein